MALWVVTKQVKVSHLNTLLDKHSIDAIFDNLSDAQAGSTDADLTLRGGTNGYDDDKLAGARQHWYWVSDATPGRLDPLTDAERSTQNRFDAAREYLILVEQQPVAVWALESSDGVERAKVYQKRIEMMLDAFNVAANFSSVAWEFIEREFAIHPREWFWTMQLQDASDTQDPNRWDEYPIGRDSPSSGADARTWYYTNITTDGFNSRIGHPTLGITFSVYQGGLARFLSG